MAELNLSLVQDKTVNLQVPQGVAFEVGFEWLNDDSTPIDDFEDYTFLAQIRRETREKSGALIHEFSLTRDADGNKYTMDEETAATWFYVSDELASELLTLNSYYLEAKMLNASGNPVMKIVVKLIPVADYAYED